MVMDLTERLQAIGLKGRQASVYLALLRMGGGSAMEVGEAAEVKRPTAYEILLDLDRRGLVRQSARGKRRIFVAEPPERLLAEPERRREWILELLPPLRALHKGAARGSAVELFEGADEVRRAHLMLLETEAGSYRCFVSMGALVDQLGEGHLTEHAEERVRRGIRSREIRLRAGETALPCAADGERWLRSVRYAPKPLVGEAAALFVSDERVLLLASAESCLAVGIADGAIAGLLAGMWDVVWEASEGV